MKSLLIIYHTTTGGSLQMARAALQGARLEPEVTTKLIHASNAHPQDLLRADGYLFVMPETLGSMSGMMKDFFDRCYYPLLEKIHAKPYALLVCAGSDGQGAARQAERILTGWRLKAAMPARIVLTHAQSPQRILLPKRLSDTDHQFCHETGLTLAAGIAAGVY